MRYVNPACTVEKQNLVACQSGLEIYFYTIQPLRPGQELLVWYCSDLAKRCSYPPLGRLALDSVGECSGETCTVQEPVAEFETCPAAIV